MDIDTANIFKRGSARYRATIQAMGRVAGKDILSLKEHELLRLISSLSNMDPPWSKDPVWSGLVVQQIIFGRARLRKV